MRYKRYPKYKDSGIEWIGEIPERWGITTLKRSCIINPSKSEIKTEKELMVSFVPMENIVATGILDCSLTKEVLEVYGGYTYFKNDDILLAKVTPCFENGNIVIAERLCNGIGFGTTELHVLRTHTSFNNRFVYYLLQTQRFKQEGIYSMCGVGGLKRIPTDFVRNFTFAHPFFDEQQSIATFLDRKTSQIDSLIADKQRLIELLEEKRSALITQAVTKGLDPNVPMKDSGIEWIGEIPEGWETVLLKHKFDVQLGKMLQPQASSPQDTLEPYLCAANIQWKSADLSVIKHMWFSPKDKNNYLLRAGDLLVSEGGDVGRSCIWQAELPRVFFQNAINRVRSKGVASITFLYYWMYFVKHIGYIDVLCNKATIPHFTADKVQNLAILLPTPTEQLQITTFLDCKTSQIDSLITDIQRSITLLEEYKQSLITAAVTGKIDVRDEGSEQIA